MTQAKLPDPIICKPSTSNGQVFICTKCMTTSDVFPEEYRPTYFIWKHSHTIAPPKSPTNKPDPIPHRSIGYL